MSLFQNHNPLHLIFKIYRVMRDFLITQRTLVATHIEAQIKGNIGGRFYENCQALYKTNTKTSDLTKTMFYQLKKEQKQILLDIRTKSMIFRCSQKRIKVFHLTLQYFIIEKSKTAVHLPSPLLKRKSRYCFISSRLTSKVEWK